MSRPRELTSEIALRVRAVRKITGLKQKDFAEKYHIPLTTFTQWEQGLRECPVYVIELLEFKVNSDYQM